MRRWIILALFLLAMAWGSQAQTTSTIQGWCETGNQSVVTSGLTSSTQVQQSFPACTVTVFVHGAGLSTIFADANNTPLSNPFTANSNGRWLFYVAAGRYDVQLSGAGFPSPLTYSDIFTSGAGSSVVLPGGSPIQTQVNNGGTFGGTPCESFGNISTGPEKIACDFHTVGPNPNVDITQFGARTCSPTNPPCASGITASINNGSAVATLSSASTFINGDGVVIYGAGPSQSLTVPTGLTVTNVLAVAGTGTGITNPSATGATTKCYKIIARDTGGGFTAATSEVCTTTGQATLGTVTVNLTGCTRAGVTVTCTASSATPLFITANLGALGEVYLAGTIGSFDNSFRGIHQVLTSPDSTHFTYQDTAVNSNNGASTSSGAGTATFYPANHLTWTAVTGAWLYYVYGGASGAETLIGVSRPNGPPGTGNLDTTFDDFGPMLMANYTFPPWIPTTPPSSPANDNLSTTILSGAGTATVTLNNAAGATVSNVGIRLDAGVGLKAAAAVSNLVAPLYIPNDPVGNPFVINNFCDLRTLQIALYQSGNLWLNETLGIGINSAPIGTVRWTGSNNTAFGFNGGASGFGPMPLVTVNEATPGVYDGGGNAVAVDGVQFVYHGQNGALLFLVDGAFGAFNNRFSNTIFGTSTSSNDLMGFGLILRNISGAFFDKVGFGSGNSSDGTSHNTPFFCNSCGDIHITSGYLLHRGFIATGGGAGGSIEITSIHYNGGGTPLVTISSGMSAQLGLNMIMDTVGHPCVANMTSKPLVVLNGCGPSGYIFNSPSVTGIVLDVDKANGVFTNALSTNQLVFTNTGRFSDGSIVVDELFQGPGAIATSSLDAVMVTNAPQAAPTCAVSAGGSVALAQWVFVVVPFWQNGAEGVQSATSAICTTTTGNQTITVNWVAAPGNPLGYRVFVGNPGTGLSVQTSLLTTTSAVFSVPFSAGQTLLNNVPLGGPTMLMSGTQGIATPAMILGGSQSVTGVQGTDTNLLSSGTISAGTGVSLCTDANHGATTSGCPSAGTFYQTVDSNGTAQTQRPTLNFISGANATATCVDNAGATRTDCTFAANATTLWSSIAAATNANAGTFAATGNTWDFSGATSFKVPVAGGAAPTADGTIADNSTTHSLNFGSNGNTLNVAAASSGAAGTGTTCAANSALTAISNTAAPTCTQLTGGGLPYTNWGVNSSCTNTGAGAGATQTCTISLNNTEANTAYKVVCGGTGAITGYPFMQGVITKNTTSVVVQYTNGTANEAVASGWANIECILTR